MGRIVAAPTAGASGVLPGVLFSLAETHQLAEDQLVEGLFTAGAVGLVIAKNASLSGAAGGCQAEIGSASAMAAAAAVELVKGSPEQALHAAAIALKNLLGLVCDPVAGLVESPCSKRNAVGTANALVAAEMALAGIESVIPFDEVVAAMYQVGRTLPLTLRETAEGGLAITPTGIKLKKKILGENDDQSACSACGECSQA
jgi:L-serine dehydratase